MAKYICEKCKYAESGYIKEFGRGAKRYGFKCKHPNAGHRRAYPFYGTTAPQDCPERREEQVLRYINKNTRRASECTTRRPKRK